MWPTRFEERLHVGRMSSGDTGGRCCQLAGECEIGRACVAIGVTNPERQPRSR